MKYLLPMVAFATSLTLFSSSYAGFGLPGKGGDPKDEFTEQWVKLQFDKSHDTALGYLMKKGHEKDKIEWGMEGALSLRASGDYEKSNDFFARVDELILEHDSAAETQVSKEAVSLFTNLRALPYDGFFYERIMVSVYKGLNYLELGDRAAARVEFRKAYERQRDAVSQFEKRIASEQEALEKATDAKDKQNAEKMDKALEDEKVKKTLDENYKRVNELAIYADYVNPFAVYLDGLYYMTNATNSDDWEHAALSLKRVADMNAGHADFVKEDIAVVEGLLGETLKESDIPKTVYVMFETGRSAARIQNDVKLPLGFLVRELNDVVFPLPNLEEIGDYDESLSVAYDDKSLKAAVVCSMDSVIAKEFKNNNPSIISRTVRTVGAKAWAQGKVTKKLGGGLGLAAGLGKKAFQQATNKADLRCWSSLPKEFQVARIPYPSSGVITITLASGISKEVTLNSDARCQVVYVQTINKGDEPMIQNFDLL